MFLPDRRRISRLPDAVRDDHSPGGRWRCADQGRERLPTGRPSAPPWKVGRAHDAEVLAELANVNRYNHDKEDYRAWATQLRDQALQLASQAKAAGSQEDARMKEQYKKIKATCTACHDVYQ